MSRTPALRYAMPNKWLVVAEFDRQIANLVKTISRLRQSWRKADATKIREFLQSIIDKVVVQVRKHKHGRRHRRTRIETWLNRANSSWFSIPSSYSDHPWPFSTSPAPFSLPVRANQVVATLRLPKTAPIPICLGAANLSGVLPGKRTARIVAQARQVAASGEKNGRTTG